MRRCSRSALQAASGSSPASPRWAPRTPGEPRAARQRQPCLRAVLQQRAGLRPFLRLLPPGTHAHGQRASAASAVALAAQRQVAPLRQREPGRPRRACERHGQARHAGLVQEGGEAPATSPAARGTGDGLRKKSSVVAVPCAWRRGSGLHALRKASSPSQASNMASTARPSVGDAVESWRCRRWTRWAGGCGARSPAGRRPWPGRAPHALARAPSHAGFQARTALWPSQLAKASFSQMSSHHAG